MEEEEEEDNEDEGEIWEHMWLEVSPARGLQQCFSEPASGCVFNVIQPVLRIQYPGTTTATMHSVTHRSAQTWVSLELPPRPPCIPRPPSSKADPPASPDPPCPALHALPAAVLAQGSEAPLSSVDRTTQKDAKSI